jgi:hypothetical protein
MEQYGRKDLDMGGYTALARVLKVHHKYNTADVMLVNTKDTIAGSATNEGKFSCKINVGNAHYDKYTNKSWGTIEPICEEDLVLVAFLDNRKAQPIIIQSFHRMEDDQNILPSDYPIVDTAESLKYLRVFPSQNYFRMDGAGNTEITFVGKSFLKIGKDVSDAHGFIDFNDLSEKDKTSGNTLGLEETAPSTDQSAKVVLPPPEIKKYLFVHRSSMLDSDTTWTKLFLDTDGTFRVTRDNNDGKLSTVEMSSEGEIKLRRQLDSNLPNEGSSNIQISINADATLTITKGDVGFTLNINSQGGLDVVAKDVSLIAQRISLVSQDNPVAHVTVSDSGVSIGG